MNTPLPPTDPPAADDKLPGEAELAALYRQLPQSEPGPALDAAVLHAAAQALTAAENPLAVERRRHPRERGDWVRPKDLPLRDIDSIGVAPHARRRRLPPWLLTLGSAASLVLVASVAWHMRGQPTAGVPASSANTESSPVSVNGSAAAAPTATPAPNRQAASNVSAMAAKPGASSLLAATSMKVESDAMMARKVTPAARDAMTHPASRKSQAKPSPEHDDARSQLAAAADHAVAAPPPPLPVAEVSAQSVPPPPPAPPAPPSEAAPAPAAMAPMRLEVPSDGQTATPEQQRELDDIRKLFAEHHDDEAQQRLENFHRSYPQWELAEDLRVHLRKP